MLNLAISGLILMTFIKIHLLQFSFGNTDQFGPYFIKPHHCWPYFIVLVLT